MDLIFNCPHCDQELAVDSSGAGVSITCPSCGQSITVPQSNGPTAHGGGGIPTTGPGPGGARSANPIASSAGAKIHLNLRVPERSAPESLIEKPLIPLEAAKDAHVQIRTKTIRHTDCIEVGHDKFDEVVSKFLAKIGEDNIVSINTLNYSYLDIGTQKLLTDFGVMIVYKG
jgi:hypothetical protein